jgi:pantoate--beta-alanine ligase
LEITGIFAALPKTAGMDIFTEIGPLKAFLRQSKENKQSIGFVPTMGALHAGHLSLVEQSNAENQITVVSIYVNPTQFNNPTDLLKYPRPEEKDVAMLKETGCDVLFQPGDKEMYSGPSLIHFDFDHLDKILEGKSRPGHFSGVALVISKFFNIVQPDIAYFGQKDFQQFKIISKLVDELKFNIRLRGMPIRREPDGLAMSSRNQRLSSAERKKAGILFQSLSWAKEKLEAGEVWNKINSGVKNMWDKQSGIALDYFVMADRENLMPLESVKSGYPCVLLIAGQVGEIRLIDNLFVW